MNFSKKRKNQRRKLRIIQVNAVELDDDLCDLFDELDDDLNEQAKNAISKHIKAMKSSVSTSSNSELSIGVILEELNGINQMYGRKMIMITNKIDILKTIHKGAFVRPGRIDRMCELKNMTQSEIRELLDIMYNRMELEYSVAGKSDEKIMEIEEYKYSPAYMVNICKISNTLREFFVNLEKYDNN